MVRAPRTLKYKLTNLRGVRVGMLTVLQRTNAKTPRPRWACVCDCGKRLTVGHNRLIDKKRPKTHCGCQNKGLPSQHPREYHTWWDAKNRCHNPKHPSYHAYGAKGTTMCEEWQNSFEIFLKYMGVRPSNKHSIDRINPYGHYEPGNVRWALPDVQAQNKRVNWKGPKP